MLGVVIGVQQLEAHILQPFLIGGMVSVHPLGVILAIASGVYTAGIAGALVAVPLVAAVNAVVVYLWPPPRPTPRSGRRTTSSPDVPRALTPDGGDEGPSVAHVRPPAR